MGTPILRFHVIDSDFIYNVPRGTTPGNARSNVQALARVVGNGCPALP